MVNGLYDFWKKELADVYLEAIKPVMKSDNQ
jgi:valyl-tRNA synthetase